MKTFILLLAFSNVCIYSFGQKEVELKHDYDAVGDAHIRAYNHTNTPVYVVFDFAYLELASFNEDLPMIKRVEPGISEFLVVMKEYEEGSPRFNYTYKWYKAHPKPNIDERFPYLFPVEKGKETSSFHIETPESFMGTGITGKWYSLGFKMEKSTAICASRKGVVVKAISNVPEIDSGSKKYQQVNNLVRVLHEDGTMAEYTNFAHNKVYYQVGETIYPGDILGEVNTAMQPFPFAGFTVFHADMRSRNWKTIIPKFHLKGEKTVKILAPGVYTSEHIDKIIGLEMTRREKKKYLK